MSTGQFFSLVQQAKAVSGLAPAADAAGRTGNYISLKNAQRVIVVFHIAQGSASAITLSLSQAKDVSGTGAKSVAGGCTIYANEDASSSTGNDTFTITQNASSYTTGAGAKEKLIVFEFDVAGAIDVNNGFKDVAPVTGASSASNITSAQIYVVPDRFIGFNGPTVMAD